MSSKRPRHSAERPRPLAFADVKPILIRLERIADSVVVVGGQAVNFWAEFYAPRVPAIDREAPFTSKDIDFCGDVRAVRICAERLGGIARVATMDDHTPSTGVVTLLDDQGVERTIDFLDAPLGLRADAVDRMAIPAEILDAAGRSTGILFRIMHPVQVMESRVHNAMKAALPSLAELLARVDDHWGAEDGVYRYNHHSYKVFRLQDMTTEIVEALQAIAPGRSLNPKFVEIVRHGTGKTFSIEDDRRWSEVTRPIVEAFFHARFFLQTGPSRWAPMTRRCARAKASSTLPVRSRVPSVLASRRPSASSGWRVPVGATPRSSSPSPTGGPARSSSAWASRSAPTPARPTATAGSRPARSPTST